MFYRIVLHICKKKMFVLSKVHGYSLHIKYYCFFKKKKVKQMGEVFSILVSKGKISEIHTPSLVIVSNKIFFLDHLLSCTLSTYCWPLCMIFLLFFFRFLLIKLKAICFFKKKSKNCNFPLYYYLVFNILVYPFCF